MMPHIEERNPLLNHPIVMHGLYGIITDLKVWKEGWSFSKTLLAFLFLASFDVAISLSSTMP